MTVRTVVVRCPDWAVVSALAAAGIADDVPAAVMFANRVVSCTPAARAEGVVRGLRRREAQSRCPRLVVLPPDPARDARAFEPVVAAVAELAPGVEVIRPGVCAVAARGPARYFGGDRAVAGRLARWIAEQTRAVATVGIADGRFAAALAAQQGGAVVPRGGSRAFLAPYPVETLDVPDLPDVLRRLGLRTLGAFAELPPRDVLARFVAERTRVHCSVGVADGRVAAALAARSGTVVPPGGSRGFLAPFPVEALGVPELPDLLRRLGLRTLGAFAALPPRDVLARFGPDGARAHRLARGLDDRPLAARQPAPELAVQAELDPPVDRVDTAAFAAKALAEELHAGLARRGLACTRVAIEAQTEHGEQLTRLWRHEGVLTPAAIADRVRWQLDGWLTGTARALPRATPVRPGTAPAPPTVVGSGTPPGPPEPGPPAGGGAPDRPTAGIVLLRLVPDEVIPYGGLQLGLWGGLGEADERAGRVLARVQGMLGPDRVVTAVLGGGRGPGDQVRLVPWGDERAPDRPAEPPWPGRMPAPSPATVLDRPLPAEVTDPTGTPVGVTGRFAVTGRPARLAAAGRDPVEIASWTGPWAADERWWDPDAATRRARFQLVGTDGTAWLATLSGGRWWIEAVYD